MLVIRFEFSVTIFEHQTDRTQKYSMNEFNLLS